MPDVHLPSMPRMADFAKLIVAAEPKLPCEPGAFLLAYQRNRASANESAIESSVLSGPLLDFMKGRCDWRGTATELKDALGEQAGNRVTKGKDWPKRPHQLAGELRRIAPNLRRAGIEVETGKSGGSRFVSLTRGSTPNSAFGVQCAHAHGTTGDSEKQEDDPGRTLEGQRNSSAQDLGRNSRSLDAVDAAGADSQLYSGEDPDDFRWVDEEFP